MYRRATRTLRASGQALPGVDRAHRPARGPYSARAYVTEPTPWTAEDGETEGGTGAPPQRRVARGLVPLLWVAALAAAAIIHATEIDRQARIREPTTLELASRDVPIEAFKPAWRIVAERKTAPAREPIDDKQAEAAEPAKPEEATRQSPVAAAERDEATVTAALERNEKVGGAQQEQLREQLSAPVVDKDTVDPTVTAAHTPLNSGTDDQPAADPIASIVQAEQDASSRVAAEKEAPRPVEVEKASSSHLPALAEAEAPAEETQSYRHARAARAEARVRTAQLSTPVGLLSKLDNQRARLFSLDLPSRYSP